MQLTNISYRHFTSTQMVETAYSFITLVSFRDAFVLMMEVLVSAETVQNLSTKLHVVTSQKTGPVILTLTTLIT